MVSKDKNGNNTLGRSLIQLIVFVSALIGVISFAYLNIYELPLGNSDVSSTIDEAESLYGMTIKIHGMIDTTITSEFSVMDHSTSDRLDAIWIGDGSLPIDGTRIIAIGQLISTVKGPVLLAEDILPVNDNTLIFSNPWGLAAMRILCVSILWFITSAILTALFAVVYHLFKHNALIGKWMRAFSELTIVSGIIVALIMLSLNQSEELIFGIPTIVLIAIVPALLLSIIIRKFGSTDIVELSDAIPLISGFLALLSILLIFIQQQLSTDDILATILTKILPESTLAISIGVLGMILIGTYITARRRETFEINDVFALAKTRVR